MPDLAPPQVPSERSSLVRIPFRDVDMHGHVHNAMFLSYFEAAINDFLRDKGLAAHFSPGSASCTYHVKKAELTFESPAFFEDALDIQIRIVRNNGSCSDSEALLFRRSRQCPSPHR